MHSASVWLPVSNNRKWNDICCNVTVVLVIYLCSFHGYVYVCVRVCVAWNEWPGSRWPIHSGKVAFVFQRGCPQVSTLLIHSKQKEALIVCCVAVKWKHTTWSLLGWKEPVGAHRSSLKLHHCLGTVGPGTAVRSEVELYRLRLVT